MVFVKTFQKRFSKLLKEFFINFEMALNFELNLIDLEKSGLEASDALNQCADAAFKSFNETAREFIQYLKESKTPQSDQEGIVELLRRSDSHLSADEEFPGRIVEVMMQLCDEAAKQDIFYYFVQVAESTERDKRILCNIIDSAIAGKSDVSESEKLFYYAFKKLRDLGCLKEPSYVIEKEVQEGQSNGIDIKKFPTKLHQILFYLIRMPESQLKIQHTHMMESVLKEGNIDCVCKIHLLYEINEEHLGIKRRNVLLNSYAETILKEIPLNDRHLDENVVQAIRMTVLSDGYRLAVPSIFLDHYEKCSVVNVVDFFDQISIWDSQFEINKLLDLLKKECYEKLIKWIDNCSGLILSPADKEQLVNIIAVRVFIEHESMPVKSQVKMLITQFNLDKEKNNCWSKHPLFDQNLIKDLHELVGYEERSKAKWRA